VQFCPRTLLHLLTTAYVLCAMCRFSAADNHRTCDALRRPAAEKRQGTKSRREIVRQQCRGLWGFNRDGGQHVTRRWIVLLRVLGGHAAKNWQAVECMPIFAARVSANPQRCDEYRDCGWRSSKNVDGRFRSEWIAEVMSCRS
jgi:hypothetical protein